MKRKLWGLLILLMIALAGVTSCNKEKIPDTPTSTSSDALVGKWRITNEENDWLLKHYDCYCDITFNTNGSAIFESYYEEDYGIFNLAQKEMFTYTYYEEDGTFIIPSKSELNDILTSAIDSESDDYGLFSSAFSIKSLTSQSFMLTDYKVNSGKTITFKRIY